MSRLAAVRGSNSGSLPPVARLAMTKGSTESTGPGIPSSGSGWISVGVRPAFCEAEPVAGIVPEHRLDTVGPFSRPLQEGHTLGLQLLVCGAAVIRLDDAAMESSLRHEGPYRFGVLWREHWRRGLD